MSNDYRAPVRPIITGNPTAAGQRTVQKPANPNAFGDMLRTRIQEQPQAGGEVTFSKHAQARAQQRGIELSEADMQKLGTAVQQAGDKGITDTLVFMNSTAFIVNVPSRVVVTMVDQSDTSQNIFTNINGAVIV